MTKILLRLEEDIKKASGFIINNIYKSVTLTNLHLGERIKAIDYIEHNFPMIYTESQLEINVGKKSKIKEHYNLELSLKENEN
ncbi:MAG: hypothetical protein KKF48_02315 [Nanoarchaeota archaeon]|nr:hypothetical protein [Nanoarchaeota archaeon]MBU1027854.1 hypothetical protein [Nanoarchaeota archaeon]